MLLWLNEKKLNLSRPDLHAWVVASDREYEVQGDVLCRRIQLKVTGTTAFKLVPVVPELFQIKVTLFAHAEACAHAGVNRTFDWIRQRFWWPGYYTQTRELVRECTTCQAAALPQTAGGYTCVLTVVDLFSRFAWVQPMKSKTAEETLETFQRIVLPVSLPKLLVSDNGTEFRNTRITLSRMGWSNGCTERCWRCFAHTSTKLARIGRDICHVLLHRTTLCSTLRLGFPRLKPSSTCSSANGCASIMRQRMSGMTTRTTKGEAGNRRRRSAI